MGIFSKLALALRGQEHMSVSQVFDLAKAEKFTGEIRFHLSEGKARRVELPPTRPLQTRIVEEEDSSRWATAPKGLDKHP